MKKILIVSTVSRQFYLFEQANIKILKSLGYEVHAAANFEDANERLDSLDIVRHHFDIQRSPFRLRNIKAYFQLKGIMKSENFDGVHCHSPMGGVLARVAARSVGVRTVLYTAHGFHFFGGAPILNWILYYPIERFLARLTTVLITINKEDYERAKNFKASKVKYVPGVGIDVKKISSTVVDKTQKRKELGLRNEDIVLLSVGEQNRNKNHEVVIRAVAKLRKPNLHYVVCGQGTMQTYLSDLVSKLKLDGNVHFLGFRDDIAEICKIADLFIFPSRREGLGLAALEAMASGLPIVTSNVHGIVDYSVDGVTGFTCSPLSADEFGQAIAKLVGSPELRAAMGKNNEKAAIVYDVKAILPLMETIYTEVLE